jgi:type I restriction enzyme R subunit
MTVGPLLEATRIVPIVFPVAADPVGAGFVESLARPGGNATGFMVFEYSMGGKTIDMDSYRAEKKAAIKIQLPDQSAEIAPVRADAYGGRGEPEVDRLSSILKAFNDQFGNIKWTDSDRIRKLVTEEIPSKVSADKAYQNAKKYSDRQNARIEHDKALKRVMTAVLKDDAELYKQFSDNPDFRRWLTDMVFSSTYEEGPRRAVSMNG